MGTDTWHYAKRCFVALFETLSKHMLILKDSVYTEILEFFDTCEMYGRNIPVVVDPFNNDSANSRYENSLEELSNSVSSEARYLKGLYLKLYEWLK